MAYLIDTSVFVAMERGLLDLAAIEAHSGPVEMSLSAITASELLHGVHRADSARRRTTRGQLVEGILARFPVLPIDLQVARVHATLWADLRARGTSIGAHDLLIAATALAHGLRIVTRNVRDFERIEGLALEVW